MRRLLALVIITALVASVIALNATRLQEAFGGGPPYYGRTVNMDKWGNPIPMLVAIDLITLVAVSLIAWRGFRRKAG